MPSRTKRVPSARRCCSRPAPRTKTACCRRARSRASTSRAGSSCSRRARPPPGAILSGEGVLSLARAFFGAGARRRHRHPLADPRRRRRVAVRRVLPAAWERRLPVGSVEACQGRGDCCESSGRRRGPASSCSATAISGHFPEVGPPPRHGRVLSARRPRCSPCHWPLSSGSSPVVTGRAQCLRDLGCIKPAAGVRGFASPARL